MEPQEVFCYDKKEDKCNNNKCFGIITVILVIAFSFVVGLLVGAAIASEILASFGAIIVLAVILGLLLILSIILLICNRKKDKKRKCCC